MVYRSLSFVSLVALVGCGSHVTGGAPIDGGAETSSDTGITPPPDSDPPPVDSGTPAKPTSKLDLLFVVDNSISMADKQVELARAIPRFIRDLTTPTGGAAVTDLHVGVISTSLGSHGTSACAVEITNRSNNDQAHLLPRAGEGSGSGFALDDSGKVVAATCSSGVTASPLTWVYVAGTEPGPELIATNTSCVIQSAKEQGCGYEESLEAMYRFLIDPAPYAKAEVRCTFGVAGDACGNNKIVIEGLDSELLAQRAAFLRADSNVVVVMLSDENDASLKPAGLNWLPWGYAKGQMQRGWSGCASVPDSFEPESAADFAKLHETFNCFSCFENGGNPSCMLPWSSSTLNTDVDARNLRAFQQTQRFGYNFLWGRDRYTKGLTQKFVLGSDNREAVNGLFASGRSPGNVLFAAIVGVPSQLVNGSGGVPKPLLSAAEWDRIVGPIGTRDPHMIESIAPRAGIPRFAGDRSVDAMNGGDRDIAYGDDLQYACIAARSGVGPGPACDGSPADAKNPLCTADRQTHFKAYPGLRHLRVAQSVNGYVASICESDLENAFAGLVARVRPLLK